MIQLRSLLNTGLCFKTSYLKTVDISDLLLKKLSLEKKEKGKGEEKGKGKRGMGKGEKEKEEKGKLGGKESGRTGKWERKGKR